MPITTQPGATTTPAARDDEAILAAVDRYVATHDLTVLSNMATLAAIGTGPCCTVI